MVVCSMFAIHALNHHLHNILYYIILTFYYYLLCVHYHHCHHQIIIYYQFKWISGTMASSSSSWLSQRVKMNICYFSLSAPYVAYEIRDQRKHLNARFYSIQKQTKHFNGLMMPVLLPLLLLLLMPLMTNNGKRCVKPFIQMKYRYICIISGIRIMDEVPSIGANF